MEIKVTDGRTARRKYPWDKLIKKGDFFVWENKEDSNKIRSASKNHGIKVSIRVNNGVLNVIRVN